MPSIFSGERVWFVMVGGFFEVREDLTGFGKGLKGNR
jgi:hypothetical protein